MSKVDLKFEDVDTSAGNGIATLPEVYHGLHWSTDAQNIYVVNRNANGISQSGLANGFKSGDQELVFQNDLVVSAEGARLGVKSLYLTAGLQGNDTVEIKAYDAAGNTLSDQIFGINSSKPTLVKLHGGDTAIYQFIAGNGNDYIAVDNMTVSASKKILNSHDAAHASEDHTHAGAFAQGQADFASHMTHMAETLF